MTVEVRGDAWRVRVRWRGLINLSLPVPSKAEGEELETALVALKDAKRADILRWLQTNPDRLIETVAALRRIQPKALTISELRKVEPKNRPGDHTVRALGAQWLKWLKTGTSRRGGPFTEGTRLGYERMWKVWLKFEDVADRPAAEIRARDIVRWGEKLRADGMKAPTVNRYMMTVQAWATWLRDDQRGEGMDELPPVRVRQLAETNRVPRAMLPEETKAMRNAMPKEWHIVFDLCLLCGLRIEEAQDLRAREIDAGGRTIILQHVTGDRELKTLNSARALAVPASLHRQLERLRVAAKKPGSPILPPRLQSYWIWYNAWREARVVTGIKARPHDLRHTRAVRWLVEDKLDLATVRDRLGHSDIDTTDRYTKAIDIYRTRTAKKK